MSTPPLFAQGDWPLSPSDAVAAIVLTDDGRYLMQHRDPKPRIFFPDMWGCFGGAIEPGEDSRTALLRELEEELGLAGALLGEPAFFTDFSMDFGFCGGPVLHRFYYTIRLPAAAAEHIRLGEGMEFGLFPPDELFQLTLTPYDCFVLWGHHSRSRFVWPANG